MKNTRILRFVLALSVAIFAANNLSAASLSDLALSGAAAVVAGQSLTVSEKLLVTSGGPETEIDSVIGFDPAVFSISNFSIGSQFSSWSTTTSTSPSSGIYDYSISGGAVTLGSSSTYTVITFTLTALVNAVTGDSDVLIMANDGLGDVTRVLDVSSVRPLNPLPSNTYNSNDLQVDVTAPPVPEPGTFLASVSALGVLLFARCRSAVGR